MTEIVFRRGIERRTYQDGSRVYVVGESTLDSVTTILDIMAKPALIRWAAKGAAEWAVYNMPHWTGLVEEDPEAAVTLIKGAPWRQTGKAAKLGSLIHDYVEHIVLGTPPPTVLEPTIPYLQAFEQFQKDYQPQYLNAEATVVSTLYGYAGTFDIGAVLPSTNGPYRALIDVKTGKGVYQEAALQLCAYRHAEYEASPDGELIDNGPWDRTLVLHLQPTGKYRLIPVVSDQVTFDAFLGLVSAYAWANLPEKERMGVPIKKLTKAQLATFNEAQATAAQPELAAETE
jgi:hypothetical protein